MSGKNQMAVFPTLFAQVTDPIRILSSRDSYSLHPPPYAVLFRHDQVRESGIGQVNCLIKFGMCAFFCGNCDVL